LPELRGQRALVTGASSGIGRALALELAARGAVLAVSARRFELLHELADEIEGAGHERPAVLPADLGRRCSATELAERAVAALGQVDVLVNNAGAGCGGAVWRVGQRDEGREAFETNFWSPLALVAALVPAMRERGHGVVVNITSTSQVTALWGLGHYSATKAALAIATETLRTELHGSGVRVLEVIPGPIDTAIQAESRLIPGAAIVLSRTPVGSAEKLARLTVRALERGRRRRLVYPRVLRVAYALPGISRWYLAALVRRHAGEIDADDPRVVRSGSMGDDVAREARAQWEREHTAGTHAGRGRP
jgi:short-subunit dehydrogenase